MAAPPSTASPASWNPAVPPPPVTGAAVGNGLDEGLGDGLGEGVALGLTDTDGRAEALVLTLAEELARLPLLAVPLAEALRLDEPLTVGENTDGGVEVPADVQAESATQASTVIRPQPTAVSLTRCAVHTMAVRAFIEPPHAPGNDHFPAAGRRNRRRKGNRVNSSGENTDEHNVKPWPRHKRAMACPPREY
jgi:hypothetical protein